MRRISFLLGWLVLSACENLTYSTNKNLPSVSYQDAVLVQSPSQKMLEAYYCPTVLPLGSYVCPPMFGPIPSIDQMQIAFDLRFLAKNPNHFPIPVAEMLTAVTIFPDQSNQKLGAVCVVFCGADQPNCTGQPGPNSCISKSSDIKSLSDFQNAAVDLLVSKGISAALGEKPSFKMPEVVSDGEILITSRFSFGPDPMLNALEYLADQSIDQLGKGQDVTFEIPFEVEGTVWFDVGEGRVEVAFGPAIGSWVVPPSAITPEF